MESLPVEMRRLIMEQFSSTELLTISLVNKAFYNEARTLLRDRANLIAVLDCENVRSFMSALEEMNVVPFSRIKLHWNANKHREVCPRPNKKLHPSSLAILDRVPWKILSVKIDGGHYAPKKCSVLQLVQKILQDSSGVLEQLEVNNHKNFLQFLQQTVQDSKFPQLKILKLEGDNTHLYNSGLNEIKKKCVEEMLARAPNLQKFYLDNMSDLWFFDSLFCGIFPAEVAQLRMQDDEYLRTVHIVPVMPSFVCLRGLRTFRLTFNHCGCYLQGSFPVFSKVTALIGFQRCPSLSVNIRAPYNEVLEVHDHLRPYASLERY